MKLIFSITIFLLFIYPIEMFSQVTNGSEFISDKLFQEKNFFKSIMVEHIGQDLETSFFNSKESRTLVNKTFSENGFLLSEEIIQEWDGINWVNDWKITRTYDNNDNKIETLEEYWDGSNWVNDRMHTYTYDGNNNRIEWLVQTWDGSNWVNQ
jgi:hypothetical protein